MLRVTLKLCRAITAAGVCVACYGASSLPADFTELAAVDFAERPSGTVDHRGVRAWQLDEGYHARAATVVLSDAMHIGRETIFRVELVLAGTADGVFGVALQPRGPGNKTLPLLQGGLWRRAPTLEFRVYEGEFSIGATSPRANGQLTVNALSVLVYRTQKQGTLWLKSLTVSYRNPQREPTAILIEKLESELITQGYALRRTPKRLVAMKPDERRYYGIAFEGAELPSDGFRDRAYLGTTWLREGYQPPLFPVGPYIYGSATVMETRARSRGLTLEALFEAHSIDVKRHWGNTIYYANLTNTPEVFVMAVNCARKHGVRVFAQLTRDLYLRPQYGWDYYHSTTKPCVEKILPGYRGLDGVLGWMGKEEAKSSEMPMVIAFRKLCRELDPSHALFTLHNKLEPFALDAEPFPEWYGFDRYRFRTLSPRIVISTPRDAAYLLHREIAQYYSESAKRGRPLVFVGQGYGHENEIKTNVMEKASGFREVTPGIWRGWKRYLPPENGMRMQNWLAVCGGAKGILLYHYYSRPFHEGRYKRNGVLHEDCLVDEQGREHRIWREFGDSIAAIRPLMPLILSWHKEGRPAGRIDSDWVVRNAFIRAFDEERYFVLVNTRIAEWDRDSPRRPGADTTLHFDEHGLAGLREAGPLTFSFTPDTQGRLWDVRTGNALSPNQDHGYTITLGPGRGVVLMSGPRSVLEDVREGFLDL